MKKLLLTAVVATAVGLSASAQGISVGPRIGVNFAKMTYDGSADDSKMNEDIKAKTGFLVGAVVNLGFTDMFSIQPELLYSSQGFKEEYKDEDGTFTDTYSYNHLQLPILLKASFGSDDVKFFVNAGPYASYWLSGKYKFEGGGSTLEDDVKFDDIKFDDGEGGTITISPNRMDYGVALGGGIGFAAGPGMLNLDLRYNLGLRDISTTTPSPTDEPTLKNRIFSVSLAYMFGGR